MSGFLNLEEDVFRDLKLTPSKILSEYISTDKPKNELQQNIATQATQILAYRNVMNNDDATKDIQTYMELLDRLQKKEVTSKGGKDKIKKQKAKSKKQKAKKPKKSKDIILQYLYNIIYDYLYIHIQKWIQTGISKSRFIYTSYLYFSICKIRFYT
jgi:hypothetical protein